MTTTTSNASTVSVRSPDAPANGASLRVSSRSFTDGGTIPMEHVFGGCGGKNATPQLSWSGAPDGTKSFAVTCFDPDAPTGSGYWHWVAFNIPAKATSLDGNEANSGYNDFGLNGYAGPCPPPGDGQHRYIFTVYALDVDGVNGASDKATGATLVFLMRGHVLATGSITGRFGH